MKNRVLVKLGLKVRAAREACNLSQEELAHESGLHRTYIGMVERGERNLTVLNLLRLASAMGAEAGELISGLPRVAPKENSG